MHRPLLYQQLFDFLHRRHLHRRPVGTVHLRHLHRRPVGTEVPYALSQEGIGKPGLALGVLVDQVQGLSCKNLTSVGAVLVTGVYLAHPAVQKSGLSGLPGGVEHQ
jgi:hypothetical protein